MGVNSDDVAAWIADEVDDADAAQLQALRDAGDPASAAELADRFAAPLSFGTAGLRGPLRAGPNGMNRTVVRRAAAGLAAWLADQPPDHPAAVGSPRAVVVGFDARHGSARFARDSAEVFAAAGFRALLLPAALPTPVTAFAVQRLGAVAGVVVTASHNPPQDNGYKVYLSDGAQLAPPTDREIEARIRAVPSARAVPLDPAGVTTLDDDIVAQYVAAVAGLVGSGPRELRIVHTALHGVGTAVARRVFAAAGFADLRPVPEQRDPDPDFPTVSFPNPEEPGALDLAFALAADVGADIVLANDPDADRCAVGVPNPDGGWRMLRGDEVGVLLADALLAKGRHGTYATTIVSSSLLRPLVEAHGERYAQTLTGFKWIARAAPDLVYGYEEALGYAVAPDLVRDKDGISAALLIAELAARLRADGSSLADRLDELAGRFGRYATDQLSVRVTDLDRIDALMARLRDEPPGTLLGTVVRVTDLLPDADVVRLEFDGGRVVVRPSGTEPKLKAYLEVVEPSGSAVDAARRLAALRTETATLLGL